jgi:broad specificity phosphatase PhoE
LKSIIFKILSYGLLVAVFGLECGAHPAQVLLIRHAEKPDDGGSDLSARGWQRAEVLPKLFSRAAFTQFGLPVALYAMKPTDDGKSIRAVQTLKYVAQSLDLPIDQDYDKEEVQPLVDEIMSDDAYEHKTVLICWEHKILEDIARAFGIANAPTWPDEQFDRVWVINFADDGSTSFKDLPENLLPGDSQH